MAASQHFTRSQLAGDASFKAAGVLPLCFVRNTPYVLLGAELARTGPNGKVYKTMWSDFGGKREALDVDVEGNASREFAEETLGLFGDCSVTAAGVQLAADLMAFQLRAKAFTLQVKHQLKSGVYHMFVALLPHVEPLMFHLATQQNLQTGAIEGAEKTAFAWVSLARLLAVTRTCAPRYFLTNAAAACGRRGRHQTRPRGRLQLHPCFASSLRLAQASGLGALVAAARASRRPPPPRTLPLREPCAPPWAALGAAGSSPEASASAAPEDAAAEVAEEIACASSEAESRLSSDAGKHASSGAEASSSVQPYCLYASSCSYWLHHQGVAAQLRSASPERLPPPPPLPLPPLGDAAAGSQTAARAVAWQVAAMGLAHLGYAPQDKCRGSAGTGAAGACMDNAAAACEGATDVGGAARSKRKHAGGKGPWPSSKAAKRRKRNRR